MRKAAILVAGLQRAEVDALLAGLSEAESRQLRRAVVDLGEVSPAERDEVVAEFLRQCKRGQSGALARGGISLDAGVELCLTGAPTAENHEKVPPPASGRGNALAFLAEADAHVLAELLEHEHPQTVALVVSRLDPDRAAHLLAALDADAREQVLRRLVDINEVDASLVAELAEHLRRGLEEYQARFRRRAEGVHRVSRIMAAAQKSSRTNAKALPSTDRNLSALRAWSLDDLCRADDASLATILSASTLETVELALLGAPADLVHRVLRRFPATERKRLTRRLHDVGPTSLRDVEEAQRRLLEAAVALEATGRISRRRDHHVSLAV